MNDYRWSQLHEGMEARFSVAVTADMLEVFAALSGDRNPLHRDPAFAREAGFPDQVAYGMLTAAFYSTLVGMHLPGKFALIHEVDVAFPAPVLVGDQLTVSGTIVQLVEAYKRIEIKARIRNGAGATVSRARIKVGLHEH
jgi:3-hydroxybutyryl-CoA dehydratase